MSWIDTEFEARADAGGNFSRMETVSAPIGGKLKRFRVETTSGCSQRAHTTSITVTRVDDPSDTRQIGPISIIDCSEHAGAIDPPYQVRGGKQYRIQLDSNGFNPNENVQGKASVEFSLFLLSEDSQTPKETKMAQRLAHIKDGHFNVAALQFFDNSISVGPIRIDYQLDLTVPQITFSVYLAGVRIGGGTINPTNPSVTVGGSVDGFKAEATITADFAAKKATYHIDLETPFSSNTFDGTLFTW